MKKYPSGFVPINFKQVGIALIIIGLIMVIPSIISYTSDSFNVSENILYIGIGLILISFYILWAAKKK
jgi:hypothetical protein